MKKLLIATVALLSLSGCAGDTPANPLPANEGYVRLSDGRTLHCVYTSTGHGMSCDWANAR